MKPHINAIIFSVAAIFCVFLITSNFRKRNDYSNTVSVTGLGSKNFVSDLIVWNGMFTEKSLNLKAAYTLLDEDQQKIKKYLVSKGLKPQEIVFTSIEIKKDFDEELNSNGEKIK